MAFVEYQAVPLRQCLCPELSNRPDYVPHHSDEICTLKKYARGRLPSIFKVSNGIIVSHGEIRLEKKYEMQCRWTALQFESIFLGLTGPYNDLYSILWNTHKTNVFNTVCRSNSQMNPSGRLLSRSCNMKCIAEKAGTTIWSMWEIWLMSKNFLFKFTA